MILQRQTSRARSSWFADYVDLVVMRDVLDIARIRQREALPRLLRQFAAQTGQLLNITKAGQAVGLESSTANRYATLLEAAFMIQRLPAWGETLGKRPSAHPKVHVIDSGLAGWLLGLSAAKINSRNPAALTEFGHLVETFAVGEILKQVSWADEVITASHFRTEAGDEVDLVLETWDGRVAGFEIKAGTRIKDPESTLGAKLGANSHSSQATSGHSQRVLVQLDGSLSDTGQHASTARRCLLSSGSPVRILPN